VFWRSYTAVAETSTSSKLSDVADFITQAKESNVPYIIRSGGFSRTRITECAITSFTMAGKTIANSEQFEAMLQELLALPIWFIETGNCTDNVDQWLIYRTSTRLYAVRAVRSGSCYKKNTPYGGPYDKFVSEINRL
jgi:hypothetical protein